MSLVDLFDLYDQAFNEVCDSWNIVNKPSWQVRWFYRYLLINPAVRYYPIKRFLDKDSSVSDRLRREKLIQSLYDSDDLILDDVISKTFSSCVLVGDCLNPNLFESFSEWWFTKAKNIFYPKGHIRHVPVTEKFYGPEYQDDCKEWMLNNTVNIKLLHELNYRDQYELLLVPKYGCKKNVLKEMTYFINQVTQESAYIVQSKMTEKTIKECFKTLEFLVMNDNESLASTAEKADVLKFSRFGIKNDPDGLNSVRVGMHRLINLAHEVLVASSYGYFPIVPFDNNFIKSDLKLTISKFRDLTPKSVFKNLYRSFDVEDMKYLINEDIKKLRKFIYQ